MPRPNYHSYFTTKQPPYPPASQSCHSPFNTPCRASAPLCWRGSLPLHNGSSDTKTTPGFSLCSGTCRKHDLLDVFGIVSWLCTCAVPSEQVHFYTSQSPRLKERHSAPCLITAPKLHGTHVLNSIPPLFYHFLWISPLGAISHSLQPAQAAKSQAYETTMSWFVIHMCSISEPLHYACFQRIQNNYN